MNITDQIVEKHGLKLEEYESIKKLHNSKDAKNNLSSSYRRLVFDELCSNFFKS